MTSHPTWRERLTTPLDIARSGLSCIHHELTMPWVVETAIEKPRSERPTLVITTGPTWLALTITALGVADTVSGHYWCNRGPAGTTGLFDLGSQLTLRHGTEVRVEMTPNECRAFHLAHGWWSGPGTDSDQVD